MKIRYYRTKKWASIFMFFCMMIMICVLINFFGVVDYDIEIESIAVVGILSMACAVLIGTVTSGVSERIILFSGYIARLIYLYLDIYKNLSLTGGGSDADGFWNNALGRYQGLRMPRYTSYPYILETFMYAFGENRLVLQYVNIIIWLLTVVVLYRCFLLLGINGKWKIFGVICITFLPWYLMLTSILMRESLITFLNTLSLYYFLKWYRKQRVLDIFMAELIVLLSMVLHSGAIGLGAAYVVAYALYDKRRQKVRFSLKTVVIFMVGIIGLFVLFFSPFRSAALSYIPKIGNIFELQRPKYNVGGSDYLVGVPYTENILIFSKNTLLRIVYFFASPVPWEWRGLTDMLAFCGDVAFHIFAILTGIYQWKKSKKEEKIFIGFLLLCVFMVGLVFAWGVSNAGTAMRHRSKLIGIEVVLLCFCMRRKLRYASGQRQLEESGRKGTDGK